MKVSEITITKLQLKQLFEEFNSKLRTDGINAKYSWFMYKNCEAMAEEYGKLAASLYDERREPDFQEIFKRQQELQATYADKDENGNLVTGQNGLPVYTKCAKEYAEEFAKLREEHKEFFEKLDKKNEVNMAVFNENVTVMATLLELSEFPNNTKPYIIGILGY